MTDKTKRMLKIEDYWQSRGGPFVNFHEQDKGHWCVDISGCFADFEIKEIANALKAANKAGRL